ncbi:MAG: DNA adenine methylase [Bacteroidota bacterium]
MFYSPLRYPGGKRRLANYVKLVLRENDLLDGDYAEVYAGGAAVALELLFEQYVNHVYINDLDPGIHAFWSLCIYHTEEFCEWIEAVDVTMEERRRQKAIYSDPSSTLFELGAATFFLNRTSRSGIITGGVIGGKNQTGKYKVDARFTKSTLINRIRRIGRNKSRITLTKMDGVEFIQHVVPTLPHRSLTYLDPPYYVAGTQALYANYYDEGDHVGVGQGIANSGANWIVSYDNVDEIRQIYQGFRRIEYDIQYSAQESYEGEEVMFFSDSLSVPEYSNPSRMSRKNLRQLELA